MATSTSPKTEESTTPEPTIPVEQFVKDPSHAIPVAGLIASDESLRTAQLTEQEWDARLTAYLNSPRHA